MQQDDWYLKQHQDLRERARRFVELSEQWEKIYLTTRENETQEQFEARDKIDNEFWHLVEDLPGDFMKLWFHEELEDIQAFARFLVEATGGNE